MTRALQLFAPDAQWTPMRMTYFNMDPWVERGGIAYVFTKDYDRHDLRDRHRWPRVKGTQIKDPGYDPEGWYPIPIACFLLAPLGSTYWCEREERRRNPRRQMAL